MKPKGKIAKMWITAHVQKKIKMITYSNFYVLQYIVKDGCQYY